MEVAVFESFAWRKRVRGCADSRSKVLQRLITTALSVVMIVSAPQASIAQMALPGKSAVGASGAAAYSIPIALPPGTAGMTPTLALDYSSQGGNGLLGVGWALSGLPSIGRCPRTMTQDGAIGGVNYDANDRFCMDGQRLVAINGGTYGADGTQYRTEIDTLSKIISHGTAGSGPAWFEVHTKSGQTMEFGNTTDSRILAQGKTSARIWALDKVSDTKSNYLTVTYVNDTTNGQFYPSRIDYTGNSSASVSPYNSVQFVYATRPDVSVQYQAGSSSQTTMRLTDVKTFVGTTLVADYRLAYQQGVTTNRSRITSVTLCDGSGNCLPATSVNWSDVTAGFGSAQTWIAQYGVSAGGWSDNNVYPRLLADVNGDGLPDVVGFASSGVLVSLNTGTSFGSAQSWNTQYGTGTTWSDNNLYPRLLADVNGDGLPDVVGFGGNGVMVSLNTGTSFGPMQTWISAYGVNGGWSNYNVYPRFVTDVNGDGLPDVVGFGSGGVYVSLNTGTSFAAAQLWNTQFGQGTGWSDSSVYPRFLTDVNGDGLPDVVGFGSGGVFVALNTGTSFASAQVWNTQFGQGTGWSDTNVYPRSLIDVNGDGLPDVVGFSSGGVIVALNTGTSFGSSQTWTTQFGTGNGWSDNNTFPRSLTDVNGDGLPDVVGFASDGAYVSLNTGTSFGIVQRWNTAYGISAGWINNNKYPRLLADVKGTGFVGVIGFGDSGVVVSTNAASGVLPDLVSSVTNGLGVTTTISYTPATNTSVVTKGSGTAFPTLDLVGSLYVVSRVDSSNGIGGTYSSTYAYSGGRIDTRGRGFLGFAQMAVKDLQTNIVQTTAYRQDFPYIGSVASVTAALNALTLSTTTNTYQFVNASGGTTISPGAAPYRVSLAQSVAQSTDLDGTALPTVTTASQYDAYNNVTQVAVSTPDGFSKTTTNTFTNDATNWYLGRLTRASVTSVAP